MMLYGVHFVKFAVKFAFSNASEMESTGTGSTQILHEEIKALASDIRTLTYANGSEELVSINFSYKS